MSVILDHNGQPANSNKFIHGADTSRTRGPQFSTRNTSLDELISSRDRDVIISLSKRLANNLGPVRSLVCQKAGYSVAKAWLPSYKGKTDRENGKLVAEWFAEDFFPLCDTRGGQWDWWENLEQVSKSIDLDGDHFTLLTVSEDGLSPRIKNIPAYSVKTKGVDFESVRGGKKRIIKGRYKGKKIINGIIYNKNDRPIAYRVSTGYAADAYTDIPASSIHHSFDPGQSDGRRGLPVATHALNELKHILKSTEYESNRQLIMSAIGLFVENDTGGPVDVGDQLGGEMTKENLVTQQINQALWYAQAGTGQKITQLKHESGGDSFESFHDRMIRSFVKGAEWSYSLIWKPTGQGTAERGEILQVRKAIESRQKRLLKWAVRVLSYAYSFKAARGELPMLDKPFGWALSKPPRLSIDDGKESKNDSEEFKLGRKNMGDLLESDGKTVEEHLNERIDEIVMRKKKIAEAEQKHGVTIDEREVVMLTPNETKEESNNESNNDNK